MGWFRSPGRDRRELAQCTDDAAVDKLIDIARHDREMDARRAAIFWLGQTGTDRAADVCAELLDLR